MDTSQKQPGVESPRSLYSRLLETNRQRQARLKRWDRGFVGAKLAVVLLAVLFAVRFLHELHGIGPLLATALVFVALIVAHESVLARLRTTKTLLAFYQRGLARLEDRWAGSGETGERFLGETHPYARDLDLFGAGSVFELLCTCRTRAGEETLAQWLLHPAVPSEVLARQAAVRELAGRTGFREELFTAGDTVRLGLHPDKLTAWGERESPSAAPLLAAVAVTLAVVWIASVAWGLTRGVYVVPVLISLLNIAVNFFLLKKLGDAPEAAAEATEDLDLLVAVLRILEREEFRSEKLSELAAALRVAGSVPSAAIRRLDRIVHYLDQRANLMVRVFDVFLFYTVLLTLKAESWRRAYGKAIRGWLAVVGQMEAIAALSCYAFEHPGDAWPAFREGAAYLEAEALAHPLLPALKAVCNDLKLDSGLQLIVLSGPNMAGKSTFIRGIGLNVVLAQMGAPVRAARLTLSPLAVGASICVLDSLQGGVSRFYAEIRRLKAIADSSLGPVPVLFLLDELFSGTNSHDRLEGTRLIVQKLLRHGAIGMVTTHDLALAKIPEDLEGKAANFHFEDRLEEGKLVFDFKLRPGVVETSNALLLMQSIGLSAGDGESEVAL